MLNRRQFLAGVTATTLATRARAESMPPPNIIFAFGDEHRYQSMGFTETPGLHTPTLDRMAREGVSFRNCISNYPVCSPFRGMLLTGQWPQQSGITDNNIPLDPDTPTIGDAFKAAGYRTGYIGKWHLGGERAEPHGFDTSLIWSNTNTHYNQSKYHPAEGKPVQPEGYNATLMTDQAIDFAAAEPGRPFFLTLSLNPPHANFLDAPERFRKLYLEGKLPVRKNSKLFHSASGGAFSTTHAAYNGYHAHVSALDHELGRLIAALEASGVMNDTIIFYSSDHGSQLGSHEVGSKRQPYEESIRIPFLVYGPGHVKPQPEREELIGAIDFMPTVLGAASIVAPESCAGKRYDLNLSALSYPDPDPEFQPIMHLSKLNSSKGNDHPAPIFRGIRGKQYTYAAGPDGPLCLFDNITDPYQQRNLVDAEGSVDTVKLMHTITKPYFQAMGDTFFDDETE